VCKHLQATINVVVNSAATVNFDECYDYALNVNTLSAEATAKFAAGCEHLESFIHVSTAYTGNIFMQAKGHVFFFHVLQ